MGISKLPKDICNVVLDASLDCGPGPVAVVIEGVIEGVDTR